MADGQTREEQHACIVCRRPYILQVTYDSESDSWSSVATSPDARVLPDPSQPLVVCSSHSGSEVGAALTEHYFGPHTHDHEHEGEDEG